MGWPTTSMLTIRRCLFLLSLFRLWWMEQWTGLGFVCRIYEPGCQSIYWKWMTPRRRYLSLAPDSKVAKVQIPGVAVSNELITPSVKVRDLGAIFDTEITMIDHVNAICRSLCHPIRNIGRIRCFLSRDTCKQTVHASVTSHLDFCNMLFWQACLHDSTAGKLQRCQNMAARVVTRTRKCDHITPVLMQLHWLPVVYRVHSKVLLQVYKVLHGLAPSYLMDLIQLYRPSRAPGFATDIGYTLQHPRTKTAWGDRAFSRLGPVLWNGLPLYIRSAPCLTSFKSRLKTFLVEPSRPSLT